MSTKSPSIEERFDLQDQEFSLIRQKLYGYDYEFIAIHKKLDRHDSQFLLVHQEINEVKGGIESFQKEFIDFKDKIYTILDAQTVMLKRLDQELVFSNQSVRRMQEKVEEHATILSRD